MVNINVRNVPIIGHDIYQVGQVYDMTALPCTPEPIITVTAFFSYIPMLAWSLVKPDPIDYVSDRFGFPHKRKRKRRFRPIMVDPIAGPGPPGLKTVSWVGLKLVERIGWYFLVLDATTDFLVNWTSMAYEWSGCDVPGTPYAQGRRNTAYVQTDFGVNDFVLTGATLEGENTWDFTGSSIFANTSGPKAFTGGATLSTNGLVTPATVLGAYIRLFPSGGGPAEIINASITGKDANTIQLATADTRDFNSFDPGQTARFHVIKSAGRLRINNWFLSGQGTLDIGYKPDP